MNVRIVCVTVTLLLLTVALAGNCSADSTTSGFSSGIVTGKLQSAAITEASGLAASRANAGVLWVHNDSGDSARVFAISTSGQLLRTYILGGASAIDCEDMAIGPGPIPGKDYLYLGDIGDNLAKRGSIKVYRVGEPKVTRSTTPETLTGVDEFALRYEDGPRDAETVMVDPANGDVYVVSKRESRSRVYYAQASSLERDGEVTLKFIAELPCGWATGGDISPTGDRVIIRGYWNASLWTRAPGTHLRDVFKTPPQSVPLEFEIWGESIAFSADGRSYYTTSEGRTPPIHRFDFPE